MLDRGNDKSLQTCMNAVKSHTTNNVYTCRHENTGSFKSSSTFSYLFDYNSADGTCRCMLHAPTGAANDQPSLDCSDGANRDTSAAASLSTIFRIDGVCGYGKQVLQAQTSANPRTCEDCPASTYNDDIFN